MNDDYHRATALNIEHADVDRIAYVCHNAWRAWNRSNGDFSDPEWGTLDLNGKTVTRRTVLSCLEGSTDVPLLTRAIVAVLDPRRAADASREPDHDRYRRDAADPFDPGFQQELLRATE